MATSLVAVVDELPVELRRLVEELEAGVHVMRQRMREKERRIAYLEENYEELYEENLALRDNNAKLLKMLKRGKKGKKSKKGKKNKKGNFAITAYRKNCRRRFFGFHVSLRINKDTNHIR